MASLENKLELIRNLLNTSIDVVEEDIRAHNDPQLDLSETKRHPIRDRYDPAVARALRCIFSASLMLRALSDVDGFLHDIIFGVCKTSTVDGQTEFSRYATSDCWFIRCFS